MNYEWILDTSIFIFIILELSNVLILYFKPTFKYGNSVSMFKAVREGASNEVKNLTHLYLIRWVANCKLIFILLLSVIVFVGDKHVKTCAVAAMILSLFAYYIALMPIMKKLEEKDGIIPKGYSKTLFWMINGMMIIFVSALVVYCVVTYGI